MLNKIEIEDINQIAVKAGKEILKIYDEKEIIVHKKIDNSPLTIADQISHKVIVEDLSKLYPEIPIISEEGETVDYAIRNECKYFWLIDPLDGTKEFINRNGEFTVNIALIENNEPVLGVIYAPVLDVLYFAQKDGVAYKKLNEDEPQRIQVNSNSKEEIIAVKSRSHSSDDENRVLEKYSVSKSVSKGSSLKFCIVAEGSAHIYYRHGPTMEWDTAAGHAIAEIAGAKVEGLTYNKEVLKNSSFLVSSVENG